jgi:hypothetical protein
MSENNTVTALVIEAVALDEAALLNRVVELERELRSVRELLSLALAALHTANVAQARQRERLRDLTAAARQAAQRVLAEREAA